FDRANLVYRVLSLNGQAAKLKALHQLLAAQPDGSAIIYTATRRAAEETAGVLQERGAEVLLYHAGLSDAARKQTQDAFMERPNALIVATNAFGMGIDKPDVPYVVHFNLPRSLEAYYQEAGRAGRDGEEAHCVLLFSYGDVRIQEFLVEHSNPTREAVERVYELCAAAGPPGTEFQLSSLLRHLGSGSSAMQLAAAGRLLEKAGYVEQATNFEAADDGPAGIAHTRVRMTGERLPPHALVLDDAALSRRRHHELAKIRRMVGYANARQCRRQKILGYFGEAWDKGNCGACDHCLNETAASHSQDQPVRDLTEGEWLNIQKILSCVARMQGRYGRNRVVQVLQGSRARDIRGTHLPQLSTYGILKDTA
ncbi:MAG: helicase-related protein, partial [Candidatus Tectomicrobia bacterium]|nr:helicase-related protein [Candidatus Tectomicrobia bacterium]